MLALTRIVGEEVLVFDETGKQVMRIIVVKQRGDKITLGFEAEPRLKIWRKEISRGDTRKD